MASNPGTPFHIVDWPQIDSKQADITVEMVCSLISPIGRHRTAHIHPSTGKRSKKRKRKELKNTSTTPAPPNPAPPPPAIASTLTIGLNSTTRHLQSLAAYSIPSSFLESPPSPGSSSQANTSRPPNPLPHISLILLPKHPKTKAPDPRYAPLPLLCCAASLAHPELAATRLVAIGPAAEAKLAAALHLPRVGVLGVMEGAPGSGAVLEYVREHVQAVDVPWMRGAESG